MVITLSFHLSKEGVARVYFDKLGNKNLKNDVTLLIWYIVKGLGMDNGHFETDAIVKCH